MSARSELRAGLEAAGWEPYLEHDYPEAMYGPSGAAFVSWYADGEIVLDDNGTGWSVSFAEDEVPVAVVLGACLAADLVTSLAQQAASDRLQDLGRPDPRSTAERVAGEAS